MYCYGLLSCNLLQNADCNPDSTVHVDGFLYSDDEVDELCDEGRMSRNYCMKCGSHQVHPLSMLSAFDTNYNAIVYHCFMHLPLCLGGLFYNTCQLATHNIQTAHFAGNFTTVLLNLIFMDLSSSSSVGRYL